MILTSTADQLEIERRKLIDLTLRNRLINYRPTKARTLKIVHENPMDIYEILVLKEKTMKFLPVKKESATESSSQTELTGQNVPEQTTPEEEKNEWKRRAPEESVSKNQTDKYLETQLDEETLQKRLYYIAQESKSVLEEQGYTVLFLALGFLEWHDPAGNPSKSPIILIPVELKRGEVREAFSLQWTKDEVLTNISLQEKIREFGITLPDFEMPEEKTGIDEYFDKVKTAIQLKAQWNIYTDIYLDFFSFSKFVMYKDLDSTAWPDEIKPINHPLITAIFNPDKTRPQIPGFDESDVDRKIRADAVYHILDADSSQIAAIEDIKAGKNLVVQGPPGTGKSQTIANAIADLLAQGKTVLFISEKMAALEVVKKRLDTVGIGDFCLELHSKKANIKELHQKLQRTLNLIPPNEVNIADQISQLELLKIDLNNYLKALNSPIGNRNLTPFKLYGMNEKVKDHFSRQSREMIRFAFPDAGNITEPEWQTGLSSLRNLSGVLQMVRPIQRHPWYGCNPGVVHPADEAEIRLMVSNTKQAFFDLQRKMEALAEVTGLSYPEKISDLCDAIGATKLFVSPDPIDRNLLLNDAWNSPNQQILFIIEEIIEFNQMRNQILKKFRPEILDTDIDAFSKEFWPLSNAFLKIINSRYRELKRQADGLYINAVKRSDSEIYNDFTYTLKCIEKRKKIRDAGSFGRSLFGSLWKDEESDTPQLKEFSNWIVQFRRKMLEEIFTEKTVEMMSRGVSPNNIQIAAEEVTNAFQVFLQQKYKLFQRLNFSPEKRFLVQEKSVEFSKFQLLFSLWEQNLSLIQPWSHYANFSGDCQSTCAKHILGPLEENDIPAEDLIPTFEGNYAEDLLRQAFRERGELARFLGATHEGKIRTFTDLDKKIIELNRLRLTWKLYQNLPDIRMEASPNSELGILKQQFERKRGRMPIRQLIKNTGNLIQKINPCFMMGPLSVAMFLDPRTITFDVIIFDEASQVRPEDALGALLRGRQAVVIGDSRQLPPTTFFDKIIADEIDDPEAVPAVTAGMESILNACVISFPSKTLRWHYRSRHESLIALSNAQFYDNRLFVYPSPAKRSDDIGLTFVHLPNTVYDRGKSQINRDEAKAVAQAVFQHFRNHPTKSLGIGTFNIKQQQAILDEVETLRLQHPEMEGFFNEELPENFFVKNLETIQGDERDVIFLSIGYGKDSNGQLYQNFGPLNQEGGERRLNVIVTRARERCVVFSNFTWRDLKVTESSVLGVKILKQFLQYAESGELPELPSIGGDTESPFEDSVYEFLKSNNYEMHKQIGCAGFRIDMAVVDQRQPGRYLIGIECDGAQYHSSKVARDRDRLRQQILKGLGWRIHRVWSTDWYRDSAATKRVLLDEIEKAKLLPLPEPVKSQPIVTVPVSSPENTDPVPAVASKPIQKNEPNSAIPEYQITVSLYIRQDLDSMTEQELLGAVREIVDREAPIHFDELYQRIKDLSGIPRFSKRYRDTIDRICRIGAARNAFAIRQNFLWPVVTPQNVLRRRKPEHSVDIDWICNEEINQAINYILKHQYATTRDDLIVSTLKIFGLQRRTEKALLRIGSMIDSKIKTEELEVRKDGMIDFRK